MSSELASRVAHKRRPLYESKVTKDEVNSNNGKQKPVRSKESREASFSDFLKRNEALLSKQQLNKYKKKEEEKEK